MTDKNDIIFPPTSTIILTKAQLDKINEESEIIRRYFWKHRKDHLKSTSDTRWD